MFSKLIRQEQHLSFIENLNFEVDLMVSDPALDADRWIAVGARRLIIHIKSITLEHTLLLAKNIKDKGVELVLGFAVDDDIEKLKSYIDGIQSVYPDRKMIDGIQCMGIEKEGYQHQSFDKKVLVNVLNIKKLYPDIPISVDGSVNLVTAKELVDAGVTRLIIGSALFDKGSVEENLKTFYSLVQ